MLRWLQPSPTLTQQDTQRSLRLMRWDGVLASAMFSLESGGFMAVLLKRPSLFSNCSDLRGSEQLAAGGEGVQASCAPGAEDRCQRHLALGTTFRPGAAADLAADNHMAPAALGGVVVRRHVRFGHEDEEFLDVALDAPAQPALQS